MGSYLAAQTSPSDQTLSSFASTLAQYGKELPQEVTEIVREMTIQPKSEPLEFSVALEKLLKETTETPCTKYDSDTRGLYSSELVGITEVPRQAASEFHPEKIKETVEKSEAPSTTESAFDIGLERLLKETSNSPSYQPQVSVKEEYPEEEPLEAKQARCWGRVSPFHWSVSGALEIKHKSNVFKSHVNQRDRVLGRHKAMTGFSDLCGSESGADIPGASQLSVDHEVGTTDTINPPEERDSESEVAVVRERAFQEPGFKEAPE